MQARGNSVDPMDLSGRSTASASSIPPSFIPPQMMGQPPRFKSGSQHGNGFPGQSSSLSQEQERLYQRQQNSMHSMEQAPRQKGEMTSSQRSSSSSQYQQLQPPHQQQQRRDSQSSVASLKPLSRPQVMAPATSTASLASVGSNASSSKPASKAQPKPNTQTTASISAATAAAQPPAQASQKMAPPAAPIKPKPPPVTVPPLKPEEVQQLLAQSDWVDKTLWTSRQIFGGQALNGFLRSTATVQRVKKQRARQNASTKAKSAGADAAKKKADNSSSNLTEQESEELLKHEIMNSRTAKKIKTEMESGLQFCELLHGTIRSILQEMNPLFTPPPPLGKELPHPNAKNFAPVKIMPPPAASAKSSNVPPMPKKTTAASQPPPAQSHGSTLRKHRKKKLPPSNAPPIELSEYDDSGKRKYSKKEHLYRISQVIRFRALRKGDFVAARVSSRDLWILARVLKDYPATNMPPAEFLKLTEPKRLQLFREKVLIKDVEEKQEASSVLVARNLVLPLPRSFSEAAEWGQRAKKGSRVYAMYPQTTSLYSATVVDNTTYCRDDDDIIVVEFDGDEPDETGSIPKCHIPARFVTLIPREFAAAQPPATSKKRKSENGTTKQSAAAAMLEGNLKGVLDDMTMLPALDGFDDLDFDLLGGT